MISENEINRKEEEKFYYFAVPIDLDIYSVKKVELVRLVEMDTYYSTRFLIYDGFDYFIADKFDLYYTLEEVKEEIKARKTAKSWNGGIEDMEKEKTKIYNEMEEIQEIEQEMDKFICFVFLTIIGIVVMFFMNADVLETKNKEIQERYEQVQEEKQLLLEQNIELENKIKELE